MPNARPFLVFCLVLIAVSFTDHRALAVGDGWPMYGHDAAHTSRSTANGPNTADIQWTYVAEGAITHPVVATDGTIYVRVAVSGFPSLQEKLVALNPNGTVKWSYLVNDARLAYPTIGTDGSIYVILNNWTDPDYLLALNSADGSLDWYFDIGRSSVGVGLSWVNNSRPLVSANGTIYVASAYGFAGYGTLFAINPDGTQKWVWDSSSDSLYCQNRTYLMYCVLESSPALAPNGTLYIKPFGQGVIALNGTTGAFMWRSDFDNADSGGADPFGQSLSVGTDNTAYTSEGDGRFNYYALGSSNKVKWRFKTENWNYAALSPISSDGATIYHTDNGGILYALDAADGTQRWQFDIPTAGVFISGNPVLAANGIIYFTSGETSGTPAGSHGYVYAVRTDTGDLLWQYDVGFPDADLAMGPDGTLYVPDDAHTLYAFQCADDLCTPPPHTVHTVTNLNDSGAGSLRQAVADGDTVQFQPGLSGTIALATPITVNTRVTINGPGAGVILLDGGAAHAVLTVPAKKDLTLNNLTIANGKPGILASGIVHINNVLFSGNANSDYPGGGALSIALGSYVSVIGSTFTNNTATSGGAIYNSGKLRVANSTFSGNSASFGGALQNSGTSDDTEMRLINTTIAQNSAAFGGGIYVQWTPTFLNTIIANNSGGNCEGVPTNGGGNIQYPGSTCGSIPVKNPLLAPLANNTGTTMTIALLPGSGAIDAGLDAVCAASPILNLDQRGAARPVDGDGNGTIHCDSGAFEARSGLPMDAPYLNDYITTTPTLTWSHVTDALWYQVEVSQSNTFTSITQTKATADGNTLFVTLDSLAEGTYFWRVHARYANNTWGAWSAVDTFTVDLP